MNVERIFGVIALCLLLSPAPLAAEGDGGALQRKAALVDRLLKESDTTRRIEAKGDAANRTTLDQAAKARAEAQRALESGEMKRGGELLDQALKLVTAASRATVDPAGRQWLHRARYEDLSVSVKNFRDAYVRHLKRLKDGGKGSLDLPAVDAQLARAGELGQKKQYADANRILEQANGQVVSGLSALLGSTDLVYELKFDTPRDEYVYEVSRGESYEALIRMVYAEGGGKGVDESKIRPLMDQSQGEAARAEEHAAAGRFPEAIKAREGANALLAQVLRLLGVMIPL